MINKELFWKRVGMILSILPFIFMMWIGASFIFSVVKTMGACGKDYPIDYIVYTNLFCEIKE